MTDLELLIDLHLRNDRQGIGSDAATLRAFDMTGLDPSSALRAADLGCGTGAASLALARRLGLRVTAIDLSPMFIARLNERANEAGLGERVTGVVGDMESPPLEPGSLDLVWSEGAVYNVGFEAGAAAWRELLRPGGAIAVSDLVWTSESRPSGVQAYWDRECPGVGTPSERIASLERAGYEPLGFFMLDDGCWDNYYGPVGAALDAFLKRNGNSAAARAIVEQHRTEEIERRNHARWYGYAFFVARTPNA